jgi:hypothetical protein
LKNLERKDFFPVLLTQELGTFENFSKILVPLLPNNYCNHEHSILTSGMPQQLEKP